MQSIENIQWPGWSVVRLIGRGSFGTVYEIQRDVFGEIEKAALKVISIPENDADIDDLRMEGYDGMSISSRFQSYLEDIVKEYSMMAKLKSHPNAVNIVNYDDCKYIQHEDGFGWDIYIKMELLTPIMKCLDQVENEQSVIDLGIAMCNALVLCKERSIIHRDIKPQNIFISQDGTFKLGDFGIAKIADRTTSGTKVGTYKYMAPEVYNNRPYGPAADQYSLGLVMYWLLNDRRTPFSPKKATVPEEDISRQRRFGGEQIPPPAHGIKQLQAIVLKACAYDPNQRFASAAEMLEALKQLKTAGAGGGVECSSPDGLTSGTVETECHIRTSVAEERATTMCISDYLFESCSIMRNYSAHCTNDFLAHNSSTTTHTPCCDWYHGAWQYLRALNCVSAPQWHKEFYSSEIAHVENVVNDCVSILISGTADYSILHLIVHAFQNTGKRIDIDIVDLCGTPISICNWYIDRIRKENPAKYSRFSFQLYQSNIALFDRGKKYDLICTDAFLTRFSSDETQSIVEKWRNLLNKKGKIVTTVRLYNRVSPSQPTFAEESRNIQVFLTKVQERYKKLTEKQVSQFGISANELSYLATRYIVNMLSNPHGDTDDIDSLFIKSGLEILKERSHVATVPGEIYETDYYRIVATKIGDD